MDINVSIETYLFFQGFILFRMFKDLPKIEEIIKKRFKDRNLERFECINCGYCCEEVLRKKEDGFAFDFNGNYVKHPYISVSVPHFEAPFFLKRVKERYQIDVKLIPSFAHFLRTHKVGFISNYQLPVKEDKSCIFFDKLEKKCNIYEAKPTSCEIFPLTAVNNDGCLNDTLDSKCKGIIDIIGELPDNLFIDLSNPIFFHLKLLFANEITLNEVRGYITEREMKALLFLKDIFYFPHVDKIYNPEFQNYKLYNLSKFISFGKKYFKGRRKKLLMEYEKELINIIKELRLFVEENK